MSLHSDAPLAPARAGARPALAAAARMRRTAARPARRCRPRAEAAQDANRAPPASRAASARGSRAEIRPYLEVAQVLSADLERRRDAHLHQRRRRRRRPHRRPAGSPRRSAIATSASIDWDDDVADQDVHSRPRRGQRRRSSPALLQFDAGALATRTGGEGPRRSASPTATTRSTSTAPMPARPFDPCRPGRVNASYRLGYVKVDDDRVAGGARRRFRQRDRAQRHRQRRHGAGPAAVRLDGRRRLCPRGYRAAASTSSSRATMSAATSSFRSARRSPSPPASAMRTSRPASSDIVRDAERRSR